MRSLSQRGKCLCGVWSESCLGSLCHSCVQAVLITVRMFCQAEQHLSGRFDYHHYYHFTCSVSYGDVGCTATLHPSVSFNLVNSWCELRRWEPFCASARLSGGSEWTGVVGWGSLQRGDWPHSAFGAVYSGLCRVFMWPNGSSPTALADPTWPKSANWWIHGVPVGMFGSSAR